MSEGQPEQSQRGEEEERKMSQGKIQHNPLSW
jgi:hypothetical protein